MNRPNDPRLSGRASLLGRGPGGPGPGRGTQARGPQPPRAPLHGGRGPGRGVPLGGRQPMMGGRTPPPGGNRGGPMGRIPIGGGRQEFGGRGPPSMMGRGPPSMMGRGLPPPPPGARRHSGPHGGQHGVPHSGPPPPPPRRMSPPMHMHPSQRAGSFVPGRGPPPINRLPPPPSGPLPRPPQAATPIQSYPPTQMNGRIPPLPVVRQSASPHMGPLGASGPSPFSNPNGPNSASSMTPTSRPLGQMPLASSNFPQPITPNNTTIPACTNSGGAATTTAAANSFSQVQIEQAWSEHVAPNGAKYYYNSISKQSTYTKPEALKEKEAAVATTERPWAEYTDPNTGKKYYSNGVTTTWEKPEGMFDNTGDSTHGTDSSNADGLEPQRKKKRTSKKETDFSSKEEAIAAFKGLLLAKDISPTSKWNEVVKTCSSDSRWEACEDVLTTGERKQALAEYQTKRGNELRTIERQERVRAREAFVQLLTDVLPSVKSFSAWNSRFSNVRDSLTKDDRFHAVADEATRESLFLDFCEEFRKRDERKKRSKKLEAQDAFISFLKEKEEQGVLTFASTFNTFLSALGEAANTDSRFEVSSSMTDADRQLYFADFVIELQTAEDDKRRRIRDARRRAEKEQREAYREALQRLAIEGKIFPFFRWRNVAELISADASYGPVHDQDREAPRELFEEFADEWNAAYRRDRTLLSQLVRPSYNKEIVVTSATSYDEFTRALLDEASKSPELYGETRRVINRESPVSSARVYFNELVMRARGVSGAPTTRRGSAVRRRDYESSEDEGEIVEDGELKESTQVAEKRNNKQSREAKRSSVKKKNSNHGNHVRTNSSADGQGGEIKRPDTEIQSKKASEREKEGHSERRADQGSEGVCLKQVTPEGESVVEKLSERDTHPSGVTQTATNSDSEKRTDHEGGKGESTKSQDSAKQSLKDFQRDTVAAKLNGGDKIDGGNHRIGIQENLDHFPGVGEPSVEMHTECDGKGVGLKHNDTAAEPLGELHDVPDGEPVVTGKSMDMTQSVADGDGVVQRLDMPGGEDDDWENDSVFDQLITLDDAQGPAESVPKQVFM